MRYAFVALALVLLIAPVRVARAADYPDTPAGFESLNKDILTALQDGKTDAAKDLIKTLVLPDADKWFVTTFGDEHGKPMAEQYAKTAEALPDALLKVYQDQLKQNRTNVKAYKVESADDKNATAQQQAQLAAMKTKVPLYGVRLIAPGKEAGMHLWSFVYVDGHFRMIGKGARR